ncbi:MAG: class I SAM-dependent methyltransferase [Candidatus Gracilibacteria bacterium]
MHSKRIQEKVKHDYDQIARDFSQSRQFPWKDFELFKAYYRKDFNVLDLGCGNGRLLKFLKKEGYKTYLGIDQSAELLKQARKEWPKEKFLLADMSDPLPVKEKFDALFAIASLHHLPPEDQEQTLKNWKKVLKPGGFLFMTNWNLHQRSFWPLLLRSFLFPTYERRGLLVPWQHKIQRYYYAFTKHRLEKILKNAGYEVLFNDYVREGESATLFSGKNILTIARYAAHAR